MLLTPIASIDCGPTPFGQTVIECVNSSNIYDDLLHDNVDQVKKSGCRS